LYKPIFGEIEVVPTDDPIEGIDVEVILGQTFLTQLRSEPPAGVAGSGNDE
jgi:hypothetical protein